jgi:lipoate-protein ligase A
MQDAIVAAFANDTGWRVEAGEWTPAHIAGAEELVVKKYATTAWNEKR